VIERGRERAQHLKKRGWERKRKRFGFSKERLGEVEAEVNISQREVGRGRGRGQRLTKRGCERERER